MPGEAAPAATPSTITTTTRGTTAMVDYVRGLHRLADDVWAWLVPDGSWGWSNAGLVAGSDASLLVDTLYDLALTREMLDAMAVVTGLRPITDAVNTHADGDHCYGNELLAPSVTLLAGRDVDHDLHETPPQRLVELVDADLGPVLTPYARKCFGPFDFSGITLRGPDCEVLTDTELRIGGRAVRVLPLGPAHTAGDVVVHVPDAGVLFAGDLLFIGGTPIMWTGPAESWMRACDAMLATGAQIVVPGHGPVTDQDGIADVRDYLAHVLGQVTAAHRARRTWPQAADEVDLGRFAGLLDPERIVVNSHVIYRHLDPAVPAVAPLELFSEMARWLEDHTSASVG